MGATVVGVATYDRVDRYTLQDGNSNQVVALVFANRNGVRAKMAYGVCVCWAAFDVFPGSTLDLSKCRVDRDQYTDMPRVFVEKYTMVNGWLVGQPTFVNFGCLCTQIALKCTIAVEGMVLGHSQIDLLRCPGMRELVPTRTLAQGRTHRSLCQCDCARPRFAIKQDMNFHRDFPLRLC